jgi:asparagine synthase (glutamine-hydrolysing)
MCGIAGFERCGAADACAESLSYSLARRGPDATTVADRGDFRLVQTRLAVIDLSDRVQYPITNEHRNLHLVFNGEIYDHADLRRELTRRGHAFATECDAEVIVHAFEEWDIDALSRLNGMFALAIVDERDGRLVLARDRFGIKPLVRTTEGPFAFASDAMALVKAGVIDGDFDYNALELYTSLHYVPPPATGVRGVCQVPPGTAIIRSADGATEELSFVRPLPADGDLRGDEARDTVSSAIDAAVKRQLVADVEVGILLSSGIDSALLLDSAVRVGGRPRAFTVAFRGMGGYDESKEAARLAHECGVTHEIEDFSWGFADAVHEVAEAFDQPFGDSSAIATLQLARLARRSSTVVLSGTGGDELFGGYSRLRAHKLRPVLRAARPLAASLGPARATGNERSTKKRQLMSYASRLLRSDSRSDLDQYLSLVGSTTSPVGRGLMHQPLSRTAVRELFVRLSRDTENDIHPFRQLQGLEFATYLPGDVLTKEDRATMQVGLEARVPLLDEQVARVAARVAADEHVSIWAGKRVLREIAGERFPQRHARRGKRGFAVPLAELFRGPWMRESADWFEAQRSELVDVAAASELLRAQRLPSTDAWAVGALVAWEVELRAARNRLRPALRSG